MNVCGKLPSPCGVALQIIQRADQENTSTRQIAHLTNGNPVLTGHITKAANLLVHRDKRQIASIIDAVTAQGIKSMRQLPLSLSQLVVRHSAACPNDYRKYRAHSVCTGTAAQKETAKVHTGVTDEAFLIWPWSQVNRLATATRLPSCTGQRVCCTAAPAVRSRIA